MKHFKVFLKKEIIENFRNYKIIIMLTVFLFIGIISPILAKYTPEIIKSAQMPGSEIKIPTPTSTDSWIQFYKNSLQMGVILTIAIFIGTMSKEYQNKTIINLVTKGVSRKSILLSKFVSMVAIYTISYLVSILGTIIYTSIYFNEVFIEKTIITLLLIYLFNILLLGILLFVSSISERESNGILYLLIIVIPLIVLRIFPNTNDYNPLTLIFSSGDILTKKIMVNDIIPAILLTILGTVASLIGSIYIFNKKEV